ncbi:hypothetical protein Tco_0275264, partial [Tanacetum coccineum]
MQRCLFLKRTLRGRSLCCVLEIRNQITPPDTCFVQAPSGGVTDDEDPEEDPADFPADRDDDDDEDEDKDKEEEEEHPASADSVPPVHRMTARISIWDDPSISLPPREEVERLLALTTPPPSPLTPLSSPLPQIPSPLTPLSSPLPQIPSPTPNSPTHIEIP